MKYVRVTPLFKINQFDPFFTPNLFHVVSLRMFTCSFCEEEKEEEDEHISWETDVIYPQVSMCYLKPSPGE